MEKKLVLRSYQKEFINGIYDCIRAGNKRVLGVAATGSGKTLIAAQLIAHAVLKKKAYARYSAS